MRSWSSSRRLIDRLVWQRVLFLLGVLLLLVSPVVGAIPGPGGLFVAALGLGLILKSSRLAKRHYVRFKRSRPKVGLWTDRALQRRSAKRRAQRRKVQQASAGN